jgi:ketosteroid isomerase-like protein
MGLKMLYRGCELVHVKLMVQDSIETAKSLYASARRQDTESVLNLFADNAIIYEPTSSTKILPGGGSYKGREAVEQFFRLLGEGLDIEQFEIIDFIAQRDKVAVLGFVRGKARMTQKLFETHFADIIKVDRNNGKIVEFRVFNDSRLLAQSMS